MITHSCLLVVTHSLTYLLIDTMKYYNVTSTTKLNELLLDPAPSTFPNINEVCQWVLNGFNGCIIAYGEKGSGKTQSLFGTYSFLLTHSLTHLLTYLLTTSRVA